MIIYYLKGYHYSGVFFKKNELRKNFSGKFFGNFSNFSAHLHFLHITGYFLWKNYFFLKILQKFYPKFFFPRPTQHLKPFSILASLHPGRITRRIPFNFGEFLSILVILDTAKMVIISIIHLCTYYEIMIVKLSRFLF